MCWENINRRTTFDIHGGHTFTKRRKPDVLPHLEILTYNVCISKSVHSIICRKKNKKE